MNKRMQMKLLLFLTVGAGVALAVVFSHAVDSFTTDGTISNDVVGSIVSYWALSVVAVLVAFTIRPQWREMALAAGSVLVVAVLAEILLRVAEVPAAMREFHGISSSRYHHLYPANAVMNEGLVDGVPVIIRTNEDGLRSTYPREEFRGYSHRMAILGDSFTFGKFVRQEATFPAVLEKVLRDRLHTDHVAVLNAGVISYSPLLEERLYDGIVRHYDPTLVILVLDATDIGDDINYAKELMHDDSVGYFEIGERAGNEDRFYSALHQLALPHLSALSRYLCYPFRAVAYRGTFASGATTTSTYDYYDFHLIVDGVVERNRFFIFRHPLDRTREYFEQTLTHISRLATKVRADCAEFVLVVAPRFQHWNANECPNNWEKGEYSVYDPYRFEYLRFFDEKASLVRFPVLNLLPTFLTSRESSLVFQDDPHWNERGHHLVAEQLADYVMSHNLLQVGAMAR